MDCKGLKVKISKNVWNKKLKSKLFSTTYAKHMLNASEKKIYKMCSLQLQHIYKIPKADLQTRFSHVLGRFWAMAMKYKKFKRALF